MSYKVSTPKIEFGLSILLDREKGVWPSVDSVKTVRLNNHPFGLSLPSPDNGLGLRILLMKPGASDLSVDAMISYINMKFSQWCLTTIPPKLREISVQDSETNPNHHFLFFEVWGDDNTVLLCGDCTDCSGAGGHATYQMRSVFLLLSMVYKVKIEKIEIPFAEGRLWRQKLEKEKELYYRS